MDEYPERPQSSQSIQNHPVRLNSCASDAASETLRLRNYLISRDISNEKCILVQDNLSSARVLTNGLASVRKMGHLGLHYFFVKDYVKRGEMDINFIPTEDMIADVLTKPIIGAQFCKLLDILLSYKLHDWRGSPL